MSLKHRIDIVCILYHMRQREVLIFRHSVNQEMLYIELAIDSGYHYGHKWKLIKFEMSFH